MMNAYDYHSKIVRAPGAPRRPMRDPRTARPAKGRTVTLSRHEYRYTAVQPEDHYERAAGRRYRAVVARALTGAADRFGPPPQPKTRVGIAADFGLRQRRCHEDHARAVGRRLGLTDGRIQRANHVFGSR